MSNPTPAPRTLTHALVACAIGACLSTASAQDAGAPADAAAVKESASIPLHGAALFGRDAAMLALVFRPPGPGPFPVVVFSHGRSGERSSRESLKQGIGREQLRYWLDRGDAVVAPIRPGYGETGGSDVEHQSFRFDGVGLCRGSTDYVHLADIVSRTVVATLDWLKAQPWADTQHVLLAGLSYGGFTTVAAGALPLPGVVGYVNYAGGAGGDPKDSPAHSCHPDEVTEVFAKLGKTTTVPNLWIYARNDEYWGPDVPAAWHAAFAAGGSRTTFVLAPPVDDGKGHTLANHSPTLWAPAVDAFLATIAFPGAASSGASAAPAAAPVAR